MINRQVENFDIEQIMESGQCFRMREIRPKEYMVIHREYCTIITEKENGNYSFDCSDDELKRIWMPYFDITRSMGDAYHYAQEKVDPADHYLHAAVRNGSGIRILRQDLWETMASFMISQNNNIPRIKKTIEALCERYGSRREHNGCEYYMFPDPESLTNEEELREMGLGYRAPFIAGMAQNVQDGKINLRSLADMPYAMANNYLQSIVGIGPKVAGCILLFGLHQLSAFPVDTWIAKVIDREYGGKFPSERYVGCEGIIQQYIFYYEQCRKRGGV